MLKKGFTILELLIVIAVIAILVGIALPRFKGMKDEGNYAKAKAELRTLKTAVESYYMHNNNTYPTDLAALIATGTSPKIITALPKDPFTAGSDYGYGKSTNGIYYVLWSVGPDNTSGITGIGDTGAITGTAGDDIYTSNGTVEWGG